MTDTPESRPSSAPRDFFVTTRWTVVLAAGRGRAPDADAALDELCRIYWYPLYAFARRRGHSHEDAEDLTQAFFARFLEKNYLDGLQAEKGRFRAFLLAAMKHFLANEWDRANRRKRGGGIPTLSLDWGGADTRYRIEPADTLTPDRLYDRAWAITLLERVIARLRQEHAAAGKLAFYEGLKPFLTVGKKAAPYEQVAVELSLSEGAARVAVHRLRQRYREILREEIGETLADPSTVDQELKALFGAF